MPIRPEKKKLYPSDWKEISRRIRFERAEGRCEQCGAPHGVTILRMIALPYEWIFPIELDPQFKHLYKKVKVVLTTAHLNHDEADCRDENLMAMCQRCHLVYDRPRKTQERRAKKDRKENPLLNDLE